MNILITNDDGYTEGAKALIEVARKIGNVTAILPNRQRSAISTALTLHKPIRMHKIEKGIFEINGTPADAVLFAVHSREFEKPDIILSGVNWGDNAALSSLICSGTVGACWQAALEGVPSVSFSMYKTSREWRDKAAWGDQTKLRKHLATVLKQLKEKLKPESFFNVNLPDDLSAPKIIFTNKIQKMRYKTLITKRFDPNGMPYFWITGNNDKVDNESELYEISVNKNITINEVPLNTLG
jgi:5'-nucleotidase